MKKAYIINLAFGAAALLALLVVCVTPSLAPVALTQLRFSRFVRETRWINDSIVAQLHPETPLAQPTEVRHLAAERARDLSIRMALAVSEVDNRKLILDFPTTADAYAPLLLGELGSKVYLQRPDLDAYEARQSAALAASGKSAVGPVIGAAASPAPGGYPGGARYPGSGSGYPGSGYPGSGHPGSGYPGSGYPGSGYPGGGYPGSIPSTAAVGAGQPAAGSPGGYPGGMPGSSPGNSARAAAPPIPASQLPPAFAHLMASSGKPPSPADLAEFERLSQKAERLDPQNALFPVLHAYVLFAQRRDDEAVIALVRAGQAREWRTGAKLAAAGKAAILQDAFGDSTGLTRLVAANVDQLGTLASIRQLANMAAFKANQAEQGGNSQRGIVIRHAIIRLGSLMTLSPGELDSQVGTALAPLGARPAAQWPENRNYRRASAAPYEAYLRRTRHLTEAAWVARQFALRDRALSVQRQVEQSHGGASGTMDTIGRFGVLFGIGLLLLANATWMLFAGAIAAAIVRGKERLGLLPFALLPALLGASLWAAWYLAGPIRLLDENSDGAGWLVLLSLAVPAAVGLIATIYCLFRRQPVLAGISRATAALAIPGASLLVLGWAALAPCAASLDRHLAAAANGQLNNESAYRAGLVHQPWPTQVPD